LAGSDESWTWRAEAVDGGPAVVFDVDGVLSDAAGRQHYLDGRQGRRKDWKGFFDAVGEDPLVEEVNRLLQLLDDELTVVLLTARPTRVRPLTLAWLERYDVRWDLLAMRPDGDRQSALSYKQATVERLRAEGFDLRLAFEDDRRNVAMFRECGIPCVYIHSGYYE
jgi:phosphoglycolate phosphatase-like HAD superfamily hydrolase